MDVSSSFLARSVNSSVNLNWAFLVYWVIALESSILLIFYFNRIVAIILCLILKPILWRRYHIKINVQSIKFSFLAGRVFFKNLTIITRDQLILVHQGRFTWRYWLFHSKKTTLIERHNGLNHKINSELPARNQLWITGLEVFFYNRTASYDSILEKLKPESTKESKSETSSTSSLRKRSATVPESLACNLGPELSGEDSLYRAKTVIEHEEVISSTFLDSLPIDVQVERGSFIFGNQTTRYLMVAYYSELLGNIDACDPASNLDYYRTNIKFDASNFQIYLKPNVTYEGIDELLKNSEEFTGHNRKESVLSFLFKPVKYILYSILFIQEVIFQLLLAPFHKLGIHFTRNRKKNKETASSDSTIDDENAEWHGLTRYLTGESLLKQKQAQTGTSAPAREPKKPVTAEYARYTHILESSRAQICYYYDSAGLVPPIAVPTDPSDGPDIGNSGIAPETGLDIRLSGAAVHYGPWADKERGALQRLIFPQICRDSEVASKLSTGERRQYTSFRINVTLLDDSTLQIPHREPSKDYEYMKAQNNVRPFGWLELKVSAGATIDISTSYIPTADKGFDNNLQVRLTGMEISSSVNHDVLYRSKKHSVNASVGYPLEWNGEAKWTFNMVSTHAELYILRDHFALLADLFKDFSSGDPVPYEYFRPFIYFINWDLVDYTLYFNVNERNIVDNPLDHANNTYFSIHGDKLAVNIKIPLETVYRKKTVASYELYTESFILSLDAPPWNTISNFMDSPEIGKSFNFKLTGSYTYYTEIEAESIDTIVVDCTCDDTTLECYGFFIKYFLYLKENYFGDDIHFRTMAEFTEETIKNRTSHTESLQKPDINSLVPENVTDFLFSFSVNRGCIILPVHLYDCGSYIAVHIDRLDIDIRINAFYMDMQADVPEGKVQYVDMAGHMNIFDKIKDRETFDPDMTIGGLAIHGHRMFGLPPDKLSYLCRWTFESGPILVDSNGDFLISLFQALYSLAFGYTDKENSLQIPLSEVMNVLNLNFKAPFVNIKLHESGTIFEITLKPFCLQLSDQPTDQYNKRIDVIIDNVTAKASQDGSIMFNLETNLKISDFVQKRQGAKRREQQYMHVLRNDGPFHRCPFLLPEDYRNRDYKNSYGSILSSLDLPVAPEPYLAQTMDLLIRQYPAELRHRLEYTYNDSDDNSVYHKHAHNEKKNDKQKMDPNCEYDNIIVDAGKVKMSTSLQFFTALSDLIVHSTNFSIYRVADRLQIDVFKYLQRINLPSDMKAKVICPRIEISLTEVESKDDVFVLDILNPEVSLSSYKDPRDAIAKRKVIIDTKIQEVSLRGFHDHIESASLVINGIFLDYLLDSDTRLCKPTIGRIKVSIIPSDICWLCECGESIFTCISKFGNALKHAKTNQEKAKMEFIYQTSVAGINYQIIHDPPCITKPSYVTRFYDDHTRLHNSWRIMTRLRHVLKSLPDSWHQKENGLFKAKKWETPETGFDEVLNIFMNWRQWECRDIQNSHILLHAFLLDEHSKHSSSFAIDFHIIELNIALRGMNSGIHITGLSVGAQKMKAKETTKSEVQELVNMDVKTETDIRVKVDSLEGHLKNLVEPASFVVSSLEELLKCQMSSNKDVPTQKRTEENKAEEDATILSISVSLGKFKNMIGLEKTKFEANGRNATTTLSAIGTTELKHIIMHSNIEFLGLSMVGESVTLCSVSGSHLSINFSGVHSMKSSTNTILVDTQNLDLSCTPGSSGITRAIDYFLEYELAPLKYLISSVLDIRSRIKSEIDLPKATSTVNKKFAFILTFGKVAIKMELLSPILHQINTQDIRISYTSDGLTAVLSIALKRLLSSFITKIGGFNYEYAVCTIDKAAGMSMFKKTGDNYYIFNNLSANACRLQLSQNDLIQTIYQSYHDIPEIKGELASLTESYNRIVNAVKLNKTELSSHSSSNAFLDKLIMKLRCRCNNISIALRISDSFVNLDSANSALSLNVIGKEMKPYGKISLPSTKLSLTSRDGKITRFPIVNFNLSVEISRAKNLGETDSTPQGFTISSSFSRVFLNTTLVDKLLKMYALLKSATSRVRSKNITSSSKIDVDSTVDITKILNIFSFQIYAKNVCFGWMFANAEYYSMQPSNLGFIFGFESSEIVCAKYAGRMSAFGLYVSLAHGSKPDNFYPLKSEKNVSNRLYFPKFKLIYHISTEKGLKCLNCKVHGDTIDIRLLTSSFLVNEPLRKSLLELQKILAGLHRSSEKQTPTSKSSPIMSHRLFGIDKLSSIFKFDGARFFISDSNGKSQSDSKLELHAPGLSTAIKWIRQKEATVEQVVSVLFCISRTDNILGYKCVPVLRDLLHISRKYMRSTTKDGANSAKTQESTYSPSSLGEWQKIMKSVHINFTLKVEPQKLLLTCKPRASVTAEISTNEIHALVNTDAGCASALLFIENIKAEIRHTYSKEASAMLSIKNFTLNAMLAQMDSERQFCTVGDMDSISALINIQQRQDIDVFKDLWIPSNYYKATPPALAKTPELLQRKKTFAEILREVSSSSAFPWCLLFLIRNIKLELNLGSSLGTLIGYVNNTWAVSRKEMNWDQNVEIQFEKFHISSKGRLGGELDLNNIRIASMIAWKKDGHILDVPLVILTAGLKSLVACISLDYHPFIVLDIKTVSVGVFNQRHRKLLEKVCCNASVGFMKVYMTALAASNLVDIYTIALRITQDIHISYNQAFNEDSIDLDPDGTHVKQLVESSAPLKTGQSVSQTFLGVIQKLRTELDVDVGGLELEVFPSSLTDSQALVIRIGKASARFSESKASTVEDSVSLLFTDAVVSLSTFKTKMSEDSLSDSIDKYIEHAHSAYGGDIIVLPSLNVNEQVSEELNSNIVRYSYSLTFGGKISVRWNLGSVYFIRQMWYTHAKALGSRLKSLRIMSSGQLADTYEENYKESLLETVNLEDRLKDVETDKKYIYIPIEEPHIETPQLRDLGNATPPLEWFGLHREKFPNVTHKLVIVTMQKIIEKAEEKYAKILH